MSARRTCRCRERGERTGERTGAFLVALAAVRAFAAVEGWLPSDAAEHLREVLTDMRDECGDDEAEVAPSAT